MASKKKVPKVPMCLIRSGTKKSRVVFTDGSEGFVPVSSLPAGLPKMDKAVLTKSREDFVEASILKMVDLFGEDLLFGM